MSFLPRASFVSRPLPSALVPIHSIATLGGSSIPAHRLRCAELASSVPLTELTGPGTQRSAFQTSQNRQLFILERQNLPI